MGFLEIFLPQWENGSVVCPVAGRFLAHFLQGNVREGRCADNEMACPECMAALPTVFHVASLDLISLWGVCLSAAPIPGPASHCITWDAGV